MTIAAAYELSLFFHILGAMALLGSLLLAATSLAPGRDGSLRLGYRALLLAALPSYIVMRVAAQWVLDESGADEEEGWITIGFITSELGLLLMIAATVCAGLSNRREGGRPGLTRAAFVISSLLVVMYVVTIWAMTTKPS